jgi:hypothetical protein
MPISLTRCASCKRHYFTREAACPFCKGSRGGASRVVKVAAAVTTTGSILLASYGCAYGAPDSRAPDTGRPPVDASVNDGASDAADAASDAADQ